MNDVYLGLGSNVGDRIENIKKAVQFFQWDTRFLDLECSSIYETRPYGNIKQDNFFNGVIKFSTQISIEALINITKELERRIGRVRRVNWGPREIDLDILLFGDYIISNEIITIPHKDLLNRDFVMVPLLEIHNEIIDPVSKKKIKLFLSDLKDKYIINKIKFNITEIESVEKLKN